MQEADLGHEVLQAVIELLALRLLIQDQAELIGQLVRAAE
jgi:hypothetical protein